MSTLAEYILTNHGKISPLLVPADLTDGTGLMNPSIIRYNDKMLVCIRHTNYTFYHSEKKLFQHPFGPLTYLHPENDMHLRTWNWIGEVDPRTLELNNVSRIDTSLFPDEEKWDFVGLEDARLVVWDDRLFTTGVRRDTTPNGVGRMELCELTITDNNVKEISRNRIPPPNNPNSYCEKNWMPVIDRPFTYVKWSNPTEVVTVDISSTNKVLCTTTHLKEGPLLSFDPRGGSQVWPIDGGYIALTHEVQLFNSEVGRKDAVYRHRFLVWDNDWNLVKYSRDFSIMGGHVEFAVGMLIEHNNMYITFGFQDNAAYILQTTLNTIMDFINE